MAMGSRISNKCSCILTVFMILASNSNCKAGRHLLQTTTLLGSGTKTLTGNIMVINVGALTGVLNVLSENDTLNAFLNGTMNDVGGFVGTLVLSQNGNLIGSLTAFGPLNNLVMTGTLSVDGISGTGNLILAGVGTLDGTIHVPLTGNGVLIFTSDNMVNGLLTLNVVSPLNI